MFPGRMTTFHSRLRSQQVKPDQDFVLYYSLGLTEAMHLFTYPTFRYKGSGCFFMMLLRRASMRE